MASCVVCVRMNKLTTDWDGLTVLRGKKSTRLALTRLTRRALFSRRHNAMHVASAGDLSFSVRERVILHAWVLAL
jgi:hypothetical protein